MADIFISYAREDEEKIQELSDVLKRQGWSVFWDRRIPAGQTWHTYIGKALVDAKCVLVGWSRYSIASRWIFEEADEGQRRGILAPFLLEPVQPPIGFRSIQAADLTGWRLYHSSPQLDRFLEDIATIVGTFLEEPTKGAEVPTGEPPTEGDLSLTSVAATEQQRPDGVTYPQHKYRVSLQTRGISDEDFKQLYDAVLSKGYAGDDTSAAWHHNYSRPGLAKRSVVLYYNDADMAEADVLAEAMESLTCDKFPAVRYTGEYSGKEEYKTLLTVHYIKH